MHLENVLTYKYDVSQGQFLSEVLAQVWIQRFSSLRLVAKLSLLFTPRMMCHKVNFKQSLTGLNSEFFFC